jgi:hypothetical protein
VRTIPIAAAPSGTAAALRLRPRVTAAEAPTAASGLAYRELRQAPLFLVSLDARELRTDQRTMDGTVFDIGKIMCGCFRNVGVGRHVRAGAIRRTIGDRRFSNGYGGWRGQIGRGVSCFGMLDWRIRRRVCEVTGRQHGWGFRVGHSREHFLEQRVRRFLLAAPRDLAPLVDVLGVACGASRLLDVFFYHRNDGVVGQPPLTRTVVIQYVAESQPALLH